MTTKDLKTVAPKTIKALLEGRAQVLYGSSETAVTGVEHDSRRIKPGDLFVAVPGGTVDGHDFIPRAVAAGAVAVLVEKEIPLPAPNVTVVKVESTPKVLAPLGVRFYEDPSARLRVIGITGTNGKTSTSYLLEQILSCAGRRCGVMGTVGYRLGAEAEPAPNTTPDPLTLQRFLRRAVDEGFTHMAMEVSSHALALDRVEGTRFSSCVFTNLTQDHLDFHKDMEDYFLAKRRLFDRTQRTGGLWGTVNLDDPFGARLVADFAEQILAYGVSESAALRADQAVFSIHGTRFLLSCGGKTLPVTLPLLGGMSVYNALAAAGAAILEEVSLEKIAEALGNARGPRGRMERVDAGQDFVVLVDYAHTPDALARILETARSVEPRRVITVFGCGGDRDRTKRAPMGAAASRFSDVVFVTSDNPRMEDPERILDDIFVGIRGGAEVHRLIDRREAIRAALAMARTGDAVVVAGKGHEDYQILGREKIHFDDREEILRALGELGWR